MPLSPATTAEAAVALDGRPLGKRGAATRRRLLDATARLLERSWTGPAGLDAAREMVDAFIRYWDGHRAVLRTRNLAAQEGDVRFRQVRNNSLRPITDHLATTVTESQAGGGVSAAISPMAAA